MKSSSSERLLSDVKAQSAALLRSKSTALLVERHLSGRSLARGSGSRMTRGDLSYVHRCAEAFSKFDVNRDGTVDAAELRAALQSLGRRVSVKQLSAWMRLNDKDSDGFLTFSEFVDAYRVLFIAHRSHQPSDPGSAVAEPVPGLCSPFATLEQREREAEAFDYTRAPIDLRSPLSSLPPSWDEAMDAADVSGARGIRAGAAFLPARLHSRPVLQHYMDVGRGAEEEAGAVRRRAEMATAKRAIEGQHRSWAHALSSNLNMVSRHLAAEEVRREQEARRQRVVAGVERTKRHRAVVKSRLKVFENRKDQSRREGVRAMRSRSISATKTRRRQREEELQLLRERVARGHSTELLSAAKTMGVTALTGDAGLCPTRHRLKLGDSVAVQTERAIARVAERTAPSGKPLTLLQEHALPAPGLYRWTPRLPRMLPGVGVVSPPFGKCHRP